MGRIQVTPKIFKSPLVAIETKSHNHRCFTFYLPLIPLTITDNSLRIWDVTTCYGESMFCFPLMRRISQPHLNKG